MDYKRGSVIRSRLICQATRIVPFTSTSAPAVAVFELENQVELRESQGRKLRELAKAGKLAEANRKLIIEKGLEHLA